MRDNLASKYRKADSVIIWNALVVIRLHKYLEWNLPDVKQRNCVHGYLRRTGDLPLGNGKRDERRNVSWDGREHGPLLRYPRCMTHVYSNSPMRHQNKWISDRLK